MAAAGGRVSSGRVAAAVAADNDAFDAIQAADAEAAAVLAAAAAAGAAAVIVAADKAAAPAAAAQAAAEAEAAAEPTSPRQDIYFSPLSDFE